MAIQNTNTTETVELDANDFLGGNYLRKEDVEGSATVTLIAVRSEEMPNSRRPKLVCEFAEHDKAMILNKTNIRRLAQMFKSRNTAEWRGAVTLYVDESIEYAGTRVGGLRIAEAIPNGGSTRQARHADTDIF